jgi:hypothetical protein
MKIFLFCAAGFFASTVYSIDNESWLKTNNPDNYYPQNGEYKALPDVCNAVTCFKCIWVYYVSSSLKGVLRLAVFSQDNKYLGSYSGIEPEPIGVKGDKILFPKSEYGDTITFIGTQPPPTIYVDGENIQFVPSSRYRP